MQNNKKPVKELLKEETNINELEYDFKSVASLIEMHRQNAYYKINEEHVNLCSEIGKYVAEKLDNGKWGDKTIASLSEYITKKYPAIKGFTRDGIYRMVQFYRTYCDNIIVAPLVRQISWTNNLVILSKTKSSDEREFYIRLCLKNHYSKRELMRQIRSCYYERYLLSNGKETPSVAKLVDDESIPSSKVLDHLSLEFLDLPNNFSEKDLRKAIIENLKYFILEIGNDFAFIGEEHRLTIGGEEYYIDLLFYNRTHSCLVAFELKLGEFIPEYVSKMNFYLEALDRYERNENEHPSVGIILCAKKNDVIVELSTARTNSPTFISTYSTKLIDVEILKKKVLEYKEFFEANKVKK